jgi:hypothetical protein
VVEKREFILWIFVYFVGNYNLKRNTMLSFLLPAAKQEQARLKLSLLVICHYLSLFVI